MDHIAFTHSNQVGVMAKRTILIRKSAQNQKSSFQSIQSVQAETQQTEDVQSKKLEKLVSRQGNSSLNTL